MKQILWVFGIIVMIMLAGTKVTAQTAYEWNFDTDLEGWVIKDGLSGAVLGGILTLQSPGDADPFMTSPDNLNILADQYNQLVVRMQNNSSSGAGQVYFSTTSTPAFNEPMHVDYSPLPNDPGFTEYVIDMGENELWKGTIKQIRFDPGAQGSYDIDFIKIVGPGGSCDLQSITFSAIDEKLITDAPFTVSATASSGLTVELEVASGPATLNGDLVTLTGEPGYVVIAANQPGNDQYCAAPEIHQAFYVRDPSAIVDRTPQVQTEGDQWVATDDLDRTLSVHEDCGDSRPDRYVGLFYFLWHGNHGSTRVKNTSSLLQENPDNPNWGYVGEFHWWGESEDGFYKADDPWVIRRQLAMISAAGVDFIFFDATNNFTYLSSVEEVCKVAQDMRSKGIQTPSIVFVTYNVGKPGVTMNALYDNFYSLGKYEDLWFIWDGKPLLLGDVSDPALREDVKRFFTIKFSWHNSNTTGEPHHWQWNDLYPQNYGWDTDPSIPEQIPVSKASHPVAMIPGRADPTGDSYCNGAQPAFDQYGMTPYTGQGRYLSEQFDHALEVDPEVVMITGWNEWIAQRFVATETNRPMFLGRQLAVGETFFVDSYNQEFNRDIAPMKGGHTDNHYYLMVDYIRKFKGMMAPADFSPATTIAIDGNFAEWQGVTPVFKDYEGDTAHRNFLQFGNQTSYTNTSGRNDIVESRATYDESNLYLYVKTAVELTPYQDTNWMMLFLDVDRNKASGWEGYDYIINREVTSETETTLKKWDGAGWIDVQTIGYALSGSEMEVTVPRSAVMLDQEAPEFYFHWADNPPHLDDISGFFTDGESAPDRRFNYHFGTSMPVVGEQSPYKSLVIPGTIEFEDFDNGGLAVAYADSDIENLGGEYRPGEAVDISTIDAGGFAVSWVNTGEWMEYTAGIEAVGDYSLVIHYGADAGEAALVLSIDGAEENLEIPLPATGGSDQYGSVIVPLALSAGTHLLQVLVEESSTGLRLDRMEFTAENVAYPGNGTGLWRSLWTAKAGGRGWFVDSLCAAVVPVVDTTWTGSPGCGAPEEFWNARWQGKVEPLFSEEYTFYLTSSDISRLWVNGELLIDGWSSGYAGETLSATVILESGQKVSVQVDFGDYLDDASIKLEWSSATQEREVVPQAQLYPEIETGLPEGKYLLPPAIFPNPARDFIQVRSQGEALKQLIVTDLNGRVLYHAPGVFSGLHRISTESWTPGIYFIQMEGADGQLFREKVIIDQWK
ncbi:MAG: PA14 domain-containing protein [Bacteroidota bacterium]